MIVLGWLQGLVFSCWLYVQLLRCLLSTTFVQGVRRFTGLKTDLLVVNAWSIACRVGRLVDWSIACLVGRLVDWSIACLVGRLVDCIIAIL